MNRSLYSTRKSATRAPRILATIFVLMGLVLGIGGVRLLMLGGSFYYAIAGIVLIASGVLLFRAEVWGSRLYGLLVVGTVIWALAEVGFDGWALAPRILPFLVLGLFLLRPGLRRMLHGRIDRPLLRSPLTWLAFIALAALCVGIALHRPYPTLPFPVAMRDAPPSTGTDWAHYGRTPAGTRYVLADQIDTTNVDRLGVAWTWRSGVGGAFKATPLQIDDTLYVCLAGNVMAAIDGDTGQERWRFDPKVKDSKIGFTTTCRGVTYYRAPEPVAECAERILTATTDARLIAVDAKTGKACSGFGVNGEVDLLAGMGEVKPGWYYVTSPPTIARNVAVLGGWVVDNVETGEPSGVVRAFNPLDGQLVWAWDMGRPDRTTAPAEGETYTRGTPNAWSLFSADDTLGLVYIPTGNATPDYYGGHRSPESEKYGSSVVALDVTSGQVRWSFQTTHHDIWDYDVPSQPVLVDIPGSNNTSTPAVVVPTKRGELFLLDRRTGAPLATVEEKPVPQTDVPEEWTSPTQPFSTGMPSFAGAPLTEAAMWGVTPIDQMLCRIAFRKLRYEGPLTPPSLGGSIQYPGFAGGMNWGSVAVDELNSVMVVNSLHVANRVQLYPRATVTEKTKFGFGGGWQLNTPYASSTDPFLSPIFTPCQQPPYGEIAVVDLRSRETLWRRPLGTANELGPLGLKSQLPLTMGVPYSGGSIVTRGGLIFMGGTMDRRMRAFDLRTGKVLWSDVLPNSAQATPMSYVSPRSQQQFVVIAVPSSDAVALSHSAQPEAQGGKEVAARSDAGGYLIAYALPASQ
ncbi:MAG TPA: membrane-bound PQQ-dependent dehydrogenase, glucose/quinate/shikimate family [Povalibacter sp.]|uniref:membrane-bound PQQ-dependent dehydrogenase, glucose/quinate/shikimate family n=1 Tax=Povalibacter sp. TaxID=1962978 RepID=UPI002B5C685E|nr:membrane-bound PQQ-dependent dehydrogenase, glucose/quinate/shikimate family [Povalibacter sp.]HMN46164.1 membrane-bound PQQ-dependent dehydrogenase, glucose/quinate/shikimate family [Povalibacter sp.]